MSKITSLINYWWHKLGWRILIGTVLICCALLIYIFLGVPANTKMHTLEKQIAKLRAGEGKRHANWIPETPEASLNTFYRSLPGEKTVPDWLEKIYDAAFENNLALDNGEYKYAQDREAAFSRYQISLPVSGSYTNIRKFVNQVLLKIPTVALDDISFSRDDAHSQEVEATVRFTLYTGVKR